MRSVLLLCALLCGVLLCAITTAQSSSASSISHVPIAELPAIASQFPANTQFGGNGLHAPLNLETSMSQEEFTMLIGIILSFAIQNILELFYLNRFEKWRNIATVFPSYQMWRGAFSDDQAAMQVCHDWSGGSVKPDADLTSITEYDLQQCYAEMLTAIKSSDVSLDNWGLSLPSVAQWGARIYAMIHIGLYAVTLTTAPQGLQLDAHLNNDQNCWEEVKNIPSSTADCAGTRVVVDTWEECQSRCSNSATCVASGIIEFGPFEHRSRCLVELSAYCKPTTLAGLYGRMQCPERTIESCGRLHGSFSDLGAFDNGDTSDAACAGSGYGQLCTVKCADGYILNDLWGSTALCGIGDDGNLRWLPSKSVTTGGRIWIPSQHMCIADPVNKFPGMLFRLVPTTFEVADAASGTSVGGKWNNVFNFVDPFHNFTIAFSNDDPQNLLTGPQFDGSLGQGVNGMRFQTYSRLAGQLPIDELVSNKHVVMVAVIRPDSPYDFLRFTSLFNLERFVFNDGRKFGTDLIDSLPMLFGTAQAPLGYLSVVTVVVTTSGSTEKVTLRINGHPIQPNGYRTAARDCFSKIPSNPTTGTCTGGGTWGETANPLEEQGPCTSSVMMCENSALVMAVKEKPLNTYIGASVGAKDASSALLSYNGAIVEFNVYNTFLDVSVDSQYHLRRLEHLEWFLATKYSIRDAFAPASPPVPNVRRISGQQPGFDISFPPQGTLWTNFLTQIEILDEYSYPTWTNNARIYSVPRGKTHVFATDLDFSRAYYIRICVARAQSITVSPFVCGSATTLTRISSL